MADLQVLTTAGWIEGTSNGAILQFLGVPYAAPPVDSLRWRSPVPMAHWSGIRKTAQFGPRCPQTVGACFKLREDTEDEDCLYLNIWNRKGCFDNPVMVWIHGGGFLGGSGSEDAYDGTTLATKGVTVVTINYRTGAFGFAAHPRLGANFGLQDQIAALRWVKANIASFGGDPGNITLFGESAGAVSIRALLSCPMAFGLFHRAILQSAGFETSVNENIRSYDDASRVTQRLFRHLGTEDIDGLRNVPVGEVKKASHLLCGAPPPEGQVHTPHNLQWTPVIDGDILCKSSHAGWFAEIPIMIGCTRDEARYFLDSSKSYSTQMLVTMARLLCGVAADSVTKYLEHAEGTNFARLERLLTVTVFQEPFVATLRKLQKAGNKVYAYYFTRCSPGSVRSGRLVEHTSEIPYVFGNLHIRQDYYDDADFILAEDMQYAWLMFARSGKPLLRKGASWSPFDDDLRSVAKFGDVEEPGTQLESALFKMVDSARQQHSREQDSRATVRHENGEIVSGL